MTAIGTAIRYDQPTPAAYTQPVEPVRPVPPRPERNSERGDSAGNARRFEYYREREAEERLPSRQNVVSDGSILPLPGRASRAQAYTPFLAQQIAQEGLDGQTSGAAQAEVIDGRTAARVAAAYRQASGDSELVLGFVRTRRLAV